jgi:hypothetical protein
MGRESCNFLYKLSSPPPPTPATGLLSRLALCSVRPAAFIAATEFRRSAALSVKSTTEFVKRSHPCVPGPKSAKRSEAEGEGGCFHAASGGCWART